jgi:hypothetical protein
MIQIQRTLLPRNLVTAIIAFKRGMLALRGTHDSSIFAITSRTSLRGEVVSNKEAELLMARSTADTFVILFELISKLKSTLGTPCSACSMFLIRTLPRNSLLATNSDSP